MRISTSQIYNVNVGTIGRQQSELVHTQQQLSTGRRVLAPSDDPVAAARALEVGQSYALNQQQKEAQGTASDALKQLDSRLGSINDILVYVRERAIQAGNAALNQSDRQAIATDVSAQFDELMSQANTVDANSEYLFSGYRGDIQPFTGSLAGVTYQGDQGVRSLQVSNSRQIPTSVSGDELFMQIDDGAGGTTDMFSVLSNFVSALNNPTITAAAYNTAIQTAMGQLDNAQENVLRLRSQTGSRQVEVDALTNIGSDLSIQYAARIEELVGVDYVAAISNFQQQNTYLEASRSTFAKITDLSLFKYIG